MFNEAKPSLKSSGDRGKSFRPWAAFGKCKPYSIWISPQKISHVPVACRAVGRAVTHSSLEQEVWSSNFGMVKRNSLLTACKFRHGQTEQFANGLPPLSSKRECCMGSMTRRWAPLTRYTLRRNTASITKDLIWFAPCLEAARQTRCVAGMDGIKIRRSAALSTEGVFFGRHFYTSMNFPTCGKIFGFSEMRTFLFLGLRVWVSEESSLTS